MEKENVSDGDSASFAPVQGTSKTNTPFKAISWILSCRSFSIRSWTAPILSTVTLELARRLWLRYPTFSRPSPLLNFLAQPYTWDLDKAPFLYWAFNRVKISDKLKLFCWKLYFNPLRNGQRSLLLTHGFTDRRIEQNSTPRVFQTTNKLICIELLLLNKLRWFWCKV